VAQTTFEEISAADFFYRNRDIAGFTNPSRAIFVAIRELVENSLDAAESHRIPPEIYVRLSYEGEAGKDTQIYKLRVEDNGAGVPPRHIPSAFGQILFGSKYKLKQQRGTFGLGGKMAILYGQITTHQPATIISSSGMPKIYMYKLMIDIQRNRPLIVDRKVLMNKEMWRGTVVEFTLEGDYFRAMPKILDYFKQTAMVNPYANLTNAYAQEVQRLLAARCKLPIAIRRRFVEGRHHKGVKPRVCDCSPTQTCNLCRSSLHNRSRNCIWGRNPQERNVPSLSFR
jgi:DNA topoisomerase-6 subunit B